MTAVTLALQILWMGALIGFRMVKMHLENALPTV